MIEHYILLALVAAMALLSMEAKACRPLLVILAAIFIGIAFVMASWRADTVGNDTIQYAQFFTLSSWFQDYDDLLMTTRFEAGYTGLNYLVTRVTDNFGFLLCLINTFYVLTMAAFVKKFTPYWYNWLVLSFITGLYYFVYNTVRAEVALSLIFLAAILYFSRHRFLALIPYGVAITMHASAIVWGLVFIFDLPLLGRLAKSKALLIPAFMVGALCLSTIVSYLPDYYMSYMDSEYAQGTVRIASLVTSFFLLVLYALTYLPKNGITPDRFRLFFLVNVGFSCMSLALPLLNRFELYFWPFSLIYILNTYPKLGSYKKLGVCLVFLLWAGYQLVSFYIRPEWYGIYPYSFR